MKKEFSMVIVAKHLFDGHRFWKDGGYVCIDEGKIKQMGKGQVTEEVILKSEHVICFDKELVMPGIIDTHTFFQDGRFIMWVRKCQISVRARIAYRDYESTKKKKER